MKNPAGVKLFGAHLRSLRVTKGWSQQMLADVANVEKSTIKRIETAAFSPTLDVLISLCRALELEMGDFMSCADITQVDSSI
ncbi:helix-turn-helix domain-containing protein [Hymenobacter yonginensis]|uniref:helix-turn-helix domain-containing protein n=1 Tax=Hymenobacter yonginensis TaxID=748197 RepID=UPI0038CC1809